MSRHIDKAAQNREVFENLSVPKALATLAIPTIIGQLIILIYNLADTFFIGRVNNPYMVAGVSLILPVYNICISIAGLVGIGGGALISRLLGAGRDDEAVKVSAFSIYTAIGVAFLFALSVLIGMNPLLNVLGASSEMEAFAREYAICVIVVGGIPTVLSITMANLLRSTGCAREASFGVSMGGIINMILDPLFMFVIFPRGKEILGAGLATATSNLLACIYFVITIKRLQGNTVLTLSPSAGMPSLQNIKAIFAIGIPSALASFLFDLDFIVIDKLATSYGDIPLAAIGIVLKAERLPLNVGVGLAQGMMPLAAYNYAARNLPRMRKAISYSRIAGLIFAFISIILYEIGGGAVMRLFINDPETVRIGTNFIRVRCIATPLMFTSFHMVNAFQALGKGKMAFFLPFARWAMFNIPLLYIMNALFGMYGIVWAQFAGDILTVTVSIIAYVQFEKKELKPMEQAMMSEAAISG